MDQNGMIDPNQLDLQSLFAASQQSNEAKARALALREKLNRAKEMQQTNYANQGQSPFGASYMGGLRDMFNIYEGGHQQRTLQPQYEQAQVQSQDAATKFKLYEEAQKRAKEAEDRRQWQANYDAKDNPATFQNIQDPNKVITVFGSKEHGYVDRNGNPVNLDGWMSIDDIDTLQGGGSSTYIPAGVTGEANTAALTLVEGARIFNDYLKIPKEDIAVLDSDKSIAKKIVRNTLTPSMFKETVKQFATDLSPETINFLRSLNRMDAMTRYRLFGATLTNNEQEAAKQVMNIIEERGLTAALDTARQNLRRHYDVTDMYKRNYGKDLIGNKLVDLGYENIDALITPTDHPSLTSMYVEKLPPMEYVPPDLQPMLAGLSEKDYLELDEAYRQFIQREINEFIGETRQLQFDEQRKQPQGG